MCVQAHKGKGFLVVMWSEKHGTEMEFHYPSIKAFAVKISQKEYGSRNAFFPLFLVHVFCFPYFFPYFSHIFVPRFWVPAFLFPTFLFSLKKQILLFLKMWPQAVSCRPAPTTYHCGQLPHFAVQFRCAVPVPAGCLRPPIFQAGKGRVVLLQRENEGWV